MSGLCALFLLATTAVPAQAQMEDGELPEIDFAVNVMQSGQVLGVDDTNPSPSINTDDLHAGFLRVRAGLNMSVQFHERVSALVMFEQEPNDFGVNFNPEVDFAVMDLKLSDGLTFRTGTPVTGLLKFRGYSDGPVVQGNPLIGNSPADIITAGQGVKLMGSYESVSFDLTVNRGFGESFHSGGVTGVDLLANLTLQPSETFGVGVGVATATGNKSLEASQGDGDNYNFPNAGARAHHAALPGETIVQGDAMVNVSSLKVSTWGGYATADNRTGYFVGVNTKASVSESFYLAGRVTYIQNTSDAVSDVDHTAMNRIQLGFGYNFFDAALFKVEGVRQVEGANSFGQIGNNWSGVMTELSYAF